MREVSISWDLGLQPSMLGLFVGKGQWQVSGHPHGRQAGREKLLLSPESLQLTRLSLTAQQC